MLKVDNTSWSASPAVPTMLIRESSLDGSGGTPEPLCSNTATPAHKTASGPFSPSRAGACCYCLHMHSIGCIKMDMFSHAQKNMDGKRLCACLAAGPPAGADQMLDMAMPTVKSTSCPPTDVEMLDEAPNAAQAELPSAYEEVGPEDAAAPEVLVLTAGDTPDAGLHPANSAAQPAAQPIGCCMYGQQAAPLKCSAFHVYQYC